MLDPTPFAAQVAVIFFLWVLGCAMIGGIFSGILEVILWCLDRNSPTRKKTAETIGYLMFGWSLLSSLLYFFLHWTLR